MNDVRFGSNIVREADALISYYANVDQARQVAKYVDRILRGAKPLTFPSSSLPSSG